MDSECHWTTGYTVWKNSRPCCGVDSYERISTDMGRVTCQKCISLFPDIRDISSEKATRPDYYGWHPVAECKDIVQEFCYNIGVAIAYLWRAGRKQGADAISDYEKAITHIQFEIERIKKQRGTNGG